MAEEPETEVREPLTREMVGSLMPAVNGIEAPPELAGKMIRWWSANCVSMRCSAQSWLTESKVCLKEGTTRTLVREKLTR